MHGLLQLSPPTPKVTPTLLQTITFCPLSYTVHLDADAARRGAVHARGGGEGDQPVVPLGAGAEEEAGADARGGRGGATLQLGRSRRGNARTPLYRLDEDELPPLQSMSLIAPVRYSSAQCKEPPAHSADGFTPWVISGETVL